MDLSNQETAKRIIKQCLDGDRKAQLVFYKHFYKLAFRICMRYAGNNAEADEMLNIGFLKVFDNLSSFQFKGSLEGWVRKIFVNTALDVLREKKQYVLIDYDDFFTEEEEPEIIKAQEEDFINADAKVLLNLIQELRPFSRIVVNLFVFDDLNAREIAELLGVSRARVKSTYYRSKLILIDKYQKIKNR